MASCSLPATARNSRQRQKQRRRTGFCGGSHDHEGGSDPSQPIIVIDVHVIATRLGNWCMWNDHSDHERIHEALHLSRLESVARVGAMPTRSGLWLPFVVPFPSWPAPFPPQQ